MRPRASNDAGPSSRAVSLMTYVRDDGKPHSVVTKKCRWMQYVRHGFGRRKVGRNSAMPQAKRTSKGKRPSKAVRARNRGVVFCSVDRRIAGGGDIVGVFGGADCRIGSRSTLAECGVVSGSPVSMMRKSPTSAWRRSISSTKKTKETPRSDIQLAVVRTGCGCGHGCGGCRGCGGVRACRVGGCGVGGCRACRVGGCGGCRVGCGGGWGGCGGWAASARWVGGCCLAWGGCALW